MDSMMDAGKDATFAASLYNDADAAAVDASEASAVETWLMTGKGAMVALGAFVLLVILAVVSLVPQAVADNGEAELRSYHVQPQDTLWSYAMDATPEGADVYATMERIKKINHLSSDQLVAGQTLLVPQA